MQFSLIQVGQSFKCLVHLVIQSLTSSTRILYWRKWKSFTIRNNQAKNGQESTLYMTLPLLISVRLLSLFIPHHLIVVGYYGFTLVVRESVRPSYVRPSVHFSFLDDNLSKHQWIFTKLDMCIDIVEIWFGIANGQILSIFDGDLPKTRPYFRFRMITWVNINGFSPNLVCALILLRSGLGLLIGKFHNFSRSYLPETCPYFRFQTITWVNNKGFSSTLL